MKPRFPSLFFRALQSDDKNQSRRFGEGLRVGYLRHRGLCLLEGIEGVEVVVEATVVLGVLGDDVA